MLKFQSKNFNTPDCSNLHSTDQTVEELVILTDAKAALYLNIWPVNPPGAERSAASPSEMNCELTMDCHPNGQWIATQTKEPNQIWEQPGTAPVHHNLPGSQNPAPQQANVPVESNHWKPGPLYRPSQSSDKI